MKHLKNFDELNELNTATYKNAASKLKEKHPGRAKELEDHANKQMFGDAKLLIHGDIEVQLSDIFYYPGERLFSTGKKHGFIEIYKLGGKTWISDRKSANMFMKALKNGNFNIEETSDKNREEEYKKYVLKRIEDENISINDLYETK